MAEEQNRPVTNQQLPQFQLQKIYAKDISFELPNAPAVFQQTGAAEIKLNLSQRVNDVSEGVYEVVLTVTVTATSEEKTVYLVEIHQAGLFTIVGFDEKSLHAVLNTLCPQALFPYASRAITGLVADGGLPPLVLQPINFDQVYAQRLAETGAQQQTETIDLDAQGNA